MTVPAYLTHGTRASYNVSRCRCDACRDAAITYMREYRQARGCAVPGCDSPYWRSFNGDGYCRRHGASRKEPDDG